MDGWMGLGNRTWAERNGRKIRIWMDGWMMIVDRRELHVHTSALMTKGAQLGDKWERCDDVSEDLLDLTLA